VRNTSILRPKPIRGFEKKKVLYLPCDLPSGTLAQTLKRMARAKRDLGFCSLYKLNGLSVLFGALGAAAAILGLEAVIASGAEDIVVLGFCGSLSRRFRIGDAVGISRAIADEGTSRHYFPRRRSFLPSPVLAGEIETLAASLPRGVVVSTDAPYRETRSWLQKSLRRGADLVDMETSAVFALAAFRGIRAAALLIVSDELFRGRWRTGFSSPLLEERARGVFLPLLGDRTGEPG
jgi:purine-nucleoside phosphorylase